jgi:hypothetical protein
MKFRMVLAAGLLVAAVAAPRTASAQGNATVGGFGGLTLNGFESHRPSLGGTMSVELTPGIQAVGEIGTIGNVLPLLSDAAFTAAQTGVQASAFYGEGGIRFVSPRRAQHVTPYAEATAGLARLSVTSTRLGALENAAVSLGLAYAGRTAPMVGLGGGVLIRTGPVFIDFGYRYKQLFPNETVETILGFGQALRTHQFRVGFGVRF